MARSVFWLTTLTTLLVCRLVAVQAQGSSTAGTTAAPGPTTAAPAGTTSSLVTLVVGTPAVATTAAPGSPTTAPAPGSPTTASGVSPISAPAPGGTPAPTGPTVPPPVLFVNLITPSPPLIAPNAHVVRPYIYVAPQPASLGPAPVPASVTLGAGGSSGVGVGGGGVSGLAGTHGVNPAALPGWLLLKMYNIANGYAPYGPGGAGPAIGGSSPTSSGVAGTAGSGATGPSPPSASPYITAVANGQLYAVTNLVDASQITAAQAASSGSSVIRCWIPKSSCGASYRNANTGTPMTLATCYNTWQAVQSVCQGLG